MLEKVSKMSEIYEKFLLQYANTSFIVEIGYKIASKKQHRLMGDASMRKSRGGSYVYQVREGLILWEEQ